MTDASDLSSLGQERIHELITKDWDAIESVIVDDVLLDLPKSSKNPRDPLQWQRRVFDDILPDSLVADASEKILFRILSMLTPATKTSKSIQDALAAQFEPLKDLFYVRISRQTSIPAPFHVLPVKAERKSIGSRSFTEKTFLLLMRNESGELEEELIRSFLDKFRLPLESVDLAQRVLLERVEPGWDPSKQFAINLDEFEKPVKPFLPGAAKLFQRDLRTLLALKLSNAEFFDLANRVLSLHFGLYLPRLAKSLNGSLALLYKELATPGSVEVEEAKLLEHDSATDHVFMGSMTLRAPSQREHRRLSKQSASRLSYDQTNKALNELHFSLLMFHRLRELARSYYLTKNPDYEDAALFEKLQYPSMFIDRLKWDDEFRSFLCRSCETLAIKFIHDQLVEGVDNEDTIRLVETAPTGVHALKRMYEIYNLQNLSANKTRAEKTGGDVMRKMLGRGDYGLLQMRKGVGHYFELGAGLLPTLLMLVVGPEREKLRVDEFWEMLRLYGFHFSEEDQGMVLQRFKAMGLYERFSDAGEANYIRNPMVSG